MIWGPGLAVLWVVAKSHLHTCVESCWNHLWFTGTSMAAGATSRDTKVLSIPWTSVAFDPMPVSLNLLIRHFQSTFDWKNGI